MSTPTRNEYLALTPIELGKYTLRNRLAVAPMTRVSARPDGEPTVDMVDYYGEFAEGGFGLVISEGTYLDAAASQGYLNQPGLVSAEHVASWREVTRRAHASGARMIAQLMHAGALSQGNAYGAATVGPSPVAPRGEMMPEYGGSGPWPVPHELSVSEIDEVIAGFVAAAGHAQAAGFDGVEVHAANGYLLDQFITDYTNQRTDSYGGPVTNRVRLTAQVVAAITAEVAPDFLVGVRLSQTKVNDFAYRWPGGRADGEVIFPALADAGASYLHIASEGRNWIDTARLADGQTITELARQTSGLPVIANGGMHDPQQAEQVLAGGHADLLSLGHGALANPDLPKKLAAGTDLERFDHDMLSPTVTVANARQWRQSRGA